MKIKHLMLTLTCLFITSVSATCNNIVTYDFINNFSEPLYLSPICSSSHCYMYFQHKIKPQGHAFVEMCATQTDNSLEINSHKITYAFAAQYRFDFKPSLPSFTGYPFGKNAFSWTADNTHIFLCSTHDYLFHRTCEF